MNKYEENIAIMILILFLSITFIKPLFAGNTATFSVSCYMPYYVTLSDGQKVLAESEKNKQEQNVAEAAQNKESNIVSQDNPNLTTKQEEIVSKDKKEIQQITTVCAK